MNWGAPLVGISKSRGQSCKECFTCGSILEDEAFSREGRKLCVCFLKGGGCSREFSDLSGSSPFSRP